MNHLYTSVDSDVMYNTRPGVRDVALLITDGYSTWDRNRCVRSRGSVNIGRDLIGNFSAYIYILYLPVCSHIHISSKCTSLHFLRFTQDYNGRRCRPE